MMKKIICLVLVGLMTLSSLGIVHGADNELNDITNHWAKKYIEKLIEIGSINGYGDGSFKPDNAIKVGEFTKILIVSLGYDNLGNSAENHWSLNYVNKAKGLELINEGEFEITDLDRNITRGEMARMIARALQEEYPQDINKYAGQIKDFNEIPEAYKEYVLKAFVKGIIKGYEDGSFKYDRTATRAEASTMIVRLLDVSERKVPELKKEEKIVIDGKEIPVENTSIIPFYNKAKEIIEGTGKSYLNIYNGDDTISLHIVPNKESTIFERTLTYDSWTKDGSEDYPQYIQVFEQTEEFYDILGEILKEFYPNKYEEILKEFKSLKWTGNEISGNADGRTYRINDRPTYTVIRIGR